MFLILLTFYLVLSNFLFLFAFPSEIFSFLTGLSSLLGPSGFWLLALPAGICSLECDNIDNNDNACNHGRKEAKAEYD